MRIKSKTERSFCGDYMIHINIESGTFPTIKEAHKRIKEIKDKLKELEEA